MSGHLRDKLQCVRSDPAPALLRGGGKGGRVGEEEVLQTSSV